MHMYVCCSAATNVVVDAGSLFALTDKFSSSLPLPYHQFFLITAQLLLGKVRARCVATYYILFFQVQIKFYFQRQMIVLCLVKN